jgi:hypothetical protein
MAKKHVKATEVNHNMLIGMMQRENAEREKRVRNGDFKMLCADGKTIGTKNDKLPQSYSIHALSKVTPAERRKRAMAAKQRSLRNHAARAELYRELSTGKTPANYHTALEAISKGAL